MSQSNCNAHVSSDDESTISDDTYSNLMNNVEKSKYWPSWCKKGIDVLIDKNNELLVGEIITINPNWLVVKINPDEQILANKCFRIYVEHASDIEQISDHKPNNINNKKINNKEMDLEEIHFSEIDDQMVDYNDQELLKSTEINNNNKKTKSKKKKKKKKHKKNNDHQNKQVNNKNDPNNSEEKEKENKTTKVTKKKRTRRDWTNEEIKALKDGHEKHKIHCNAKKGMPGVWSHILKDDEFRIILAGRDNNSLSKKWRNMKHDV